MLSSEIHVLKAEFDEERRQKEMFQQSEHERGRSDSEDMIQRRLTHLPVVPSMRRVMMSCVMKRHAGSSELSVRSPMQKMLKRKEKTEKANRRKRKR